MPNTLSQDWLKTCVWKQDIFADKVVFVTGGAGTICRVQTEALVLLGAKAAIIGRNPEKTARAAEEMSSLRPGAEVIGIGMVDVRDVKSLADAVAKTVKEFGKIDFVIAGAAGNFLSPIANLSSNAFRTVTEIDLVGSFNTVKATFEQLRANKGHILFVSATLYYKGLPMQAHAAAAKAGVDSLMKTVAVELGPLGIQSNSIAPGAIGGTEGMDRLMPSDMSERAKKLIPLGHYGETTDIANATVFLFSPAGKYVTGQILVVDAAQWQVGGPELELYPDFTIALNEGDFKL